MKKCSKVLIGLSGLLLIAACTGGSSGDIKSSSESTQLSPQAALGQKIFMDQSLSASGKMSCVSCHDPANFHAQTNELPVQLGGANLDVPGFRAVPSLRYLNLTPAFYFAADGTPTGGFARDGRVNSLALQAALPFLAPHEMANPDQASVIEKLKNAPYAEQFRQVYGAGIFSNPDQAFSRLQLSLQLYQMEDSAFHPYDSKYDQFLAGKVKLDQAELRGLALFNNPTKGNCAACHLSNRSAAGAPPLFTDFTYDNLGVPRNAAIPANADPAYFDLGLCGPNRLDLTMRHDLCGAFKVPTLRNVATRKVFFHNGRFSNLTEVVGFYVRRDTNPEEWYPLNSSGSADKFNDLPSAYARNVNIIEVPYNRKPGMAPALTADEIADVVSFLETLTDGYR